MPPKKTTNASLKCKLSPRIGSVNQWVALLLAEKMHKSFIGNLWLKQFIKTNRKVKYKSKNFRKPQICKRNFTKQIRQQENLLADGGTKCQLESSKQNRVQLPSRNQQSKPLLQHPILQKPNI